MATNGVMIGARAEYDKPTIRMNRWLANWKRRGKQFNQKPTCYIMKRGLGIADSGPRIAAYGRQSRIADRRLRIAVCRLWIADCGLWLWIVDCGLRIANRGSKIVYPGLWIVDCRSCIVVDSGSRILKSIAIINHGPVYRANMQV